MYRACIHIELRRLAIIVAALMLLGACAGHARYVLVTSRNDVDHSSGSQRYICLTGAESSRLPGMLALYSERDITRYERSRRTGDPLEDILFHVIRSDYRTAGTLLERHGRDVPPGLRLLLLADLSYETGTDIPAERLRSLYQEAFEAQSCDLNRDLIQLRIRQMRYGR